MLGAADSNGNGLGLAFSPAVGVREQQSAGAQRWRARLCRQRSDR